MVNKQTNKQNLFAKFMFSSFYHFTLTGDDETRDRVKILSFPSYCRYKTAIKRLESAPDAWLNERLVRALGGFTVPHRNTRLMYCKEEFEHPMLGYHEKSCDHLGKYLEQAFTLSSLARHSPQIGWREGHDKQHRSCYSLALICILDSVSTSAFEHIKKESGHLLDDLV